jgi:phosphoglycolate phosphatase
MKIILFDIDCTLLHTGGSGRIAFEKTFKDLYGIEDVWQDLVPDGKTDPAIVEELIARIFKRPPTTDELFKVSKSYQEHFEREIKNPPNFRLMPGVSEMLQTLSSKNLLLGVATGNYETAAWAKLECGGLRKFFQFGGFGSDSHDRMELTRLAVERGRKIAGKEIPDEAVFLLGDTPHDIRAGKAAGAITIGVATGRTSVQEFKLCGADYAVEDFRNADRLLTILGEKDV